VHACEEIFGMTCLAIARADMMSIVCQGHVLLAGYQGHVLAIAISHWQHIASSNAGMYSTVVKESEISCESVLTS